MLAVSARATVEGGTGSTLSTRCHKTNCRDWHPRRCPCRAELGEAPNLAHGQPGTGMSLRPLSPRPFLPAAPIQPMNPARSVATRHALSLHSGPDPVFVREIAVVGPGIVGLPMAALLASAELWAPDGVPTRVTVVQRPSPSSGWKVGAINAGRSPIGALEPAIDELVAQGAGSGRLRATTQYGDIRDADLVMVCVQTERRGTAPDYTHLLEALRGVATALAQRTSGSVPLVVIESTLAPTTLQTVVRPLFAQHGLEEGRDVLLAHSPSRVTRGGIVERIASTDKLIGTLSPETGPRVAAVAR